MTSPYARERIENWVSDFCTGDRVREFPAVAQEYAPEVLTRLLLGAAERGGVDPAEVTEEDLRAALLEKVTELELPASVRDVVPDLAAAFLEDLERAGRVGGGRALGLYVRALRQPFREAAGAPRAPVRRPSAKVSANDPCPCGSGRKYKKCCQR